MSYQSQNQKWDWTHLGYYWTRSWWVMGSKARLHAQKWQSNLASIQPAITWLNKNGPWAHHQHVVMMYLADWHQVYPNYSKRKSITFHVENCFQEVNEILSPESGISFSYISKRKHKTVMEWNWSLCSDKKKKLIFQKMTISFSDQHNSKYFFLFFFNVRFLSFQVSFSRWS